MKIIFAEVITIGDELLYGQTLDTNTQWMGQELNRVGIKISRKMAIGDRREDIVSALDEAQQRADIILITGGLGPTKDDITKTTLADYFDSPISVHPQALADLKSLFAQRNYPLTALNEQQAALPDKCEMVPNAMGTAPGMWFEQDGKVFVSMPGVPYEMKAMMTSTVLPRLQETFALPVIFHQMIQTVGIGESWLAEKIADWETALPEHIRLAYLPSFGKVKLRLTATGDNLLDLEEEVATQVTALEPLIKKYIFGYGDISLEEAVGRDLLAAGKTLALAESCTGGLVAHRVTSVPGSSRYFRGGLIPYDNALKVKPLGVAQATLREHGAVSEATVREMAAKVRTLLGADVGLATSGIAGPGGGTAEKPVGTIWIAVADEEGTYAKKLTLTNNRMVNVQRTNVAVLNLLRLRLNDLLKGVEN
ncbi:MAG: competence/damage-inducible protein A [Tunicatimonas sp.]